MLPTFYNSRVTFDELENGDRWIKYFPSLPFSFISKKERN